MTATQENPYIGLRPFEGKDKDNYRGRKADVAKLINKLFAGRVTVLHASYGVGKTSFLNVRVIPELERRKIHCVTIDKWQQDPALTLRHNLSKSGAVDLTAYGDIAEALARRTKPIVIILDQFEQFLLRLSGALASGARQGVDARAEPKPEQVIGQTTNQEIAFLEWLGNLLRATDLVFVLIAMREEFFAGLETLKKYRIDAFAHTYRLESMNDDDAAAAIQEPAEHHGKHFEADLVKLLIRDLQPRNLDWHNNPGALMNPGVSLPFLQLVCRHLFEASKKDPTIEVSLYKTLGGLRGILKGYVEECTRRFDPYWHRAATILRKMALPGGVKVPWIASSLAQDTGFELAEVEGVFAVLREAGLLRDRLVVRFTDNGILTSETWSEFVHDEASQLLIQWSQDKLRESRTRRIIGIVSLSAFALSLLGYGLYQRWNAEQVMQNELMLKRAELEDVLERLPPAAQITDEQGHEDRWEALHGILGEARNAYTTEKEIVEFLRPYKDRIPERRRWVASTAFPTGDHEAYREAVVVQISQADARYFDPGAMEDVWAQEVARVADNWTLALPKTIVLLQEAEQPQGNVFVWYPLRGGAAALRLISPEIAPGRLAVKLTDVQTEALRDDTASCAPTGGLGDTSGQPWSCVDVWTRPVWDRIEATIDVEAALVAQLSAMVRDGSIGDPADLVECGVRNLAHGDDSVVASLRVVHPNKIIAYTRNGDLPAGFVDKSKSGRLVALVDHWENETYRDAIDQGDTGEDSPLQVRNVRLRRVREGTGDYCSCFQGGTGCSLERRSRPKSDDTRYVELAAATRFFGQYGFLPGDLAEPEQELDVADQPVRERIDVLTQQWAANLDTIVSAGRVESWLGESITPQQMEDLRITTRDLTEGSKDAVDDDWWQLTALSLAIEDKLEPASDPDAPAGPTEYPAKAVAWAATLAAQEIGRNQRPGPEPTGKPGDLYFACRPLSAAAGESLSEPCREAARKVVTDAAVKRFTDQCEDYEFTLRSRRWYRLLPELEHLTNQGRDQTLHACYLHALVGLGWPGIQHLMDRIAEPPPTKLGLDVIDVGERVELEATIVRETGRTLGRRDPERLAREQEGIRKRILGFAETLQAEDDVVTLLEKVYGSCSELTVPQWCLDLYQGIATLSMFEARGKKWSRAQYWRHAWLIDLLVREERGDPKKAGLALKHIAEAEKHRPKLERQIAENQAMWLHRYRVQANIYLAFAEGLTRPESEAKFAEVQKNLDAIKQQLLEPKDISSRAFHAKEYVRMQLRLHLRRRQYSEAQAFIDKVSQEGELAKVRAYMPDDGVLRYREFLLALRRGEEGRLTATRLAADTKGDSAEHLLVRAFAGVLLYGADVRDATRNAMHEALLELTLGEYSTAEADYLRLLYYWYLRKGNSEGEAEGMLRDRWNQIHKKNPQWSTNYTVRVANDDPDLLAEALIGHYLNDADASRIVDEVLASTVGNPLRVQCLANFYKALKSDIQGDKKEFDDALQAVKASRMYSYSEYMMMEFLSSLEKSPPR